jgi:hypothetical protein
MSSKMRPEGACRRRIRVGGMSWDSRGRIRQSWWRGNLMGGGSWLDDDDEGGGGGGHGMM